MKNWLIRLIPTLEEFFWTETNRNFEFDTLDGDFIPFLAKNQFKSQIRKHAMKLKTGHGKSEIQEKIAMILNPTNT